MGGAGHSAVAYRPGATVLHRLRPQCKLAAVFAFVLAVVATPREAFWAFAVHAVVLVGLARLAGLGLPTLARRLALEAPFVAFALFLPLVARGERVDVAGLSLSVGGLWGAWNVLAKATLGLAASVVLVTTTRVPDLLHGLERLRVPRAFTTIAAFMVRYAEVVAGEMSRMKVARQSRGHDPRWFWQARVVAASAGALFVRCFERGERVYLAMVSRGYEGAMPVLAGGAAPASQWATALALPALGAGVAVAAWALRT